MNTTDRELLARWSTGDSDAAERLVTRHFDAMVRFFQTKAGDAAEDLVQTTFLRCGEQAAKFRGQGSVRAFLYGIARRVLYEHYRAKKRHGGPPLHESAVLDLNPGVATLAAQRDDQRVLVRALQSIPIAYQVAIELYYWEGMSVREVAEVLEVAEGTVKSHLFRGREALRDAIEQVPASVGETASVRLMVQDWIDEVQLKVQGDV